MLTKDNIKKVVIGSIILVLFMISFFILVKPDISEAAINQFDTTFDDDGYVVYTDSQHHGGGQGVVVQSDGKYLVTGYASNPENIIDMYLWRYNIDGSLDTTFNSVGYVTSYNVLGENITTGARDIELQDDGKIVITGYASELVDGLVTATDMVIWRLNPDGTLDTTFNDVGFLISPIILDRSIGEEIRIQNDGKIVIAGTVSEIDEEGVNIGGYMSIWRYNANGTLDTTFNDIGYTYDTSLGRTSLTGIEIDNYGKYILIGTYLLKYNNNGTLDTDFNSTGYVDVKSVIPGCNSTPYDVRIDADNKYIIVGTCVVSGFDSDLLILRYNDVGTLDLSFNTTGIVTNSNLAGGNRNIGYGLSLTQDNKYVVVGVGANVDDVLGGIVIARYRADGSIDNSFGIDGVAVDSDHNWAEAQDVVIDEDGKYIVVGHIRYPDTSDMIILRYETSNQIGVVEGMGVEYGGSDVSTEGSNGVVGEGKEVSLYTGSNLLTTVDVTIWEDLDWSEVSGEIDSTEFRSYVYNLAGAEGVNSYTLYVPRRAGDNRVGLQLVTGGVSVENVSPSAAYEGLADFGSRSEADGDTDIVEVEGIEYWRITGLTQDLAGYSYYQPEESRETPVLPTLPATGSNIYLYLFGGMGKVLF